nr:MAG TPA: hypothetical protein [Bacteriophage sp.]
MDNKVKPRISAVITDCLKCPHSKRYDSSQGSTGSVLVCKEKEQIIISDDYIYHTDKINMSNFIPDWCPLDCYTGENEIYGLKEKNLRDSQCEVPMVRYNN